MRSNRLALMSLLVAGVALLATDAFARNLHPHHRPDRPLRDRCAPGTLPDGFTKVITMIADGIVEDPNAMLLDPMPVWREHFGRSDQYIEQDRQNALEFFERKFGLDGEQLMADGRAMFMPFYFSPEIEYRAINISGEAVDEDGWFLIDTGWTLMVTDPNGIEIPDGQFEGVLMTPGSFLLFGEYYLVPTGIPDDCPRSYRPEPIRIHYESGCPIIPGMGGLVTFVCDLSHPEWGQGIAAGISAAKPNERGELVFDNRNVITFPPAPLPPEPRRPHRRPNRR